MKLPWILAGFGLGLAVYLIANPPQTPGYATGSDDVEGAAAKTSAWGTKQRAKGAGGQFAGKIKEGLGSLTGSDQLADEGVGDQVAGNVKGAVGQVAEAAGQTLRDLNK